MWMFCLMLVRKIGYKNLVWATKDLQKKLARKAYEIRKDKFLCQWIGHRNPLCNKCSTVAKKYYAWYEKENPLLGVCFGQKGLMMQQHYVNHFAKIWQNNS